mgnify:CR=1 FL=1
MDDGRRITTGPLHPPRRGRPRKVESGHGLGTGAPDALDGTPPNGGAPASLAIAPIPPRLLDVHGLADYLSLPEATVYDLAARNVLRRVRVPLPDGGELRKLLFDRAEVDRLVETWKD